MYKIVIVTNNKENFSSLATELGAIEDCMIAWNDSLQKAKETASESTPDLMVIDEEVDKVSNLDVARQIVISNPMINITLVSVLSPKDFHEASEGLGIVAQLPRQPRKEEAVKLLETLQSILPPKPPS